MIDHVRSIIIEYLAGRFSADELATRLPDGWELDEAGDAAARDLTLLVVGYVAELERGDRSESALREVLISLVVAGETSTPTLQGTKTKVVVFERMTASQLAGKALREVPA
jgi:hypothetical protein